MLVICSVPVVVLFTKFDALLPVALGKLAPADRRRPLQERLLMAEPLIEGIFNKADVWGRLAQLMHPPKSCVRIGGLYGVLHIYTGSHVVCVPGAHKSNEGCGKLLETTADVLDRGTLQMLLISAQEANMALCARYAVQRWVNTTNDVLLS